MMVLAEQRDLGMDLETVVDLEVALENSRSTQLQVRKIISPFTHSGQFLKIKSEKVRPHDVSINTAVI